MEYNKNTTTVVDENNFEDKDTKRVLDKSTLNKVALRSVLLQASFNFARMQAGGWLYALIPALKKIHKNKNDLRKSMKMHLEFFNAHPMDASFIMGIVLALEEAKENLQTIRSIKIATMGPLGGIGDALFWFTLLPMTAGIGAAIAIGTGEVGSGSILGPIMFLVVFNIVHFVLRFWFLHYAYKLGVSAVSKLTENTKHVSKAATIIGLTVIGALIATYIRLDLGFIIHAGQKMVNMQTDVIDKIMPKLLPLLYTFFMFWLLKKGKNTITLIIVTLIVGIAVSFVKGYLNA